MNLLDSLLLSLLSPMVLAFLLGIGATLIRSDLKIPDQIYAALTLYLLFAFGLKGGAKLGGIVFADVIGPLGAALALCVAIPLWSYAILRRLGKFGAVNAAALAAHSGSVSAVTFGECLAFLDLMHVAHEPFLHGLLGVVLGRWAGLGVGGATVLGTLAASASYLAAPAAVRVALPQANPALYLTSALALTFPLNVVIGIPAYFPFARWLFA